MKIFLIFIMLCILFQKEASAEHSKAICYLKDRFFIQQVNDIYLNPQSYRDKVIQIEGFFNSYIDENKIERYVVFRKTAGCCENDGSSGFEFVYKKGKPNFKQDEWIFVEGVVKERSGKEPNSIYLEATSVVKKDKGDKKELVF
ncbi:MAG: hypothetical protein FWC15_00010 [Fibromonadales bacterium]|nr:hypothetical protein [Fibromonadales bacterium]